MVTIPTTPTIKKHYLSAQKLSGILGFPITSPKFKLRNCWFPCVSTLMRYYERFSVNTTDRCARWKNQNHLLQFQKISIRIFNILFQNYPLNQYYRDYQFCPFSTAEISCWYMAFIRKIVFQRNSNASPIDLWNKFFGQFKLRVFIQLKTFTVLAWFTTFELAVILMNTSENLDSIWKYGANSPLFRQLKHQKRF